MFDEDITLVDVPLVADPDASQEMSSSTAESIADEELRGCRLLVIRKAIAPINLEDTYGGVVQLSCTFQPAAGLRFASAQVRLRLTSPQNLHIIDLLPRIVDDTAPVEFTLDRKGQIGLKNLPVEPSFELGVSKKYTKYHCKIQGTGIGTSLARWDFRENPDRKDGIGAEQILALTLPVTGQVRAELLVSARVVRTGLLGYAEAMRDLVIGDSTTTHSYSLQLDIPTKPTTSLLTRIFTLLDQ